MLFSFFKRHNFVRDTGLTDVRDVAVVGNGYVSPELGKVIDSADWVVRFNTAHNCGRAGNRTDCLVLVNRGIPARQFSENVSLINKTAMQNAKRFILAVDPKRLPPPYSEGYSDGSNDFSRKMIKRIIGDKPFSFIPTQCHLELITELMTLGAPSDVLPSTGALYIKYLLSVQSTLKLNLFGFTHQGWNGHSWDAEKKWVNSLTNVKRVRTDIIS